MRNVDVETPLKPERLALLGEISPMYAGQKFLALYVIITAEGHSLPTRLGHLGGFLAVNFGHPRQYVLGAVESHIRPAVLAEPHVHELVGEFVFAKMAYPDMVYQHIHRPLHAASSPNKSRNSTGRASCQHR